MGASQPVRMRVPVLGPLTTEPHEHPLAYTGEVCVWCRRIPQCTLSAARWFDRRVSTEFKAKVVPMVWSLYCGEAVVCVRYSAKISAHPEMNMGIYFLP